MLDSLLNLYRGATRISTKLTQPASSTPEDTNNPFHDTLIGKCGTVKFLKHRTCKTSFFFRNVNLSIIRKVQHTQRKDFNSYVAKLSCRNFNFILSFSIRNDNCHFGKAFSCSSRLSEGVLNQVINSLT